MSPIMAGTDANMQAAAALHLSLLARTVATARTDRSPWHQGVGRGRPTACRARRARIGRAHGVAHSAGVDAQRDPQDGGGGGPGGAGMWGWWGGAGAAMRALPGAIRAAWFRDAGAPPRPTPTRQDHGAGVDLPRRPVVRSWPSQHPWPGRQAPLGRCRALAR